MKDIIHEWIGKGVSIVLFIILGILCILFPDQIMSGVPRFGGIVLIAYAVYHLYVFFHTQSHEIEVGKYLIYIVLGFVIIFMKENIYETLGVIWALLSMLEAAEEINEFFWKRHAEWYQVILAALAIGLAVVLLFGPKEHFSFHIRILGAEIILNALMQRHDMLQNPKEFARKTKSE